MAETLYNGAEVPTQPGDEAIMSLGWTLPPGPGAPQGLTTTAFDPAAIHIATEGPVGLATRRAALRVHRRGRLTSPGHLTHEASLVRAAGAPIG